MHSHVRAKQLPVLCSFRLAGGGALYTNDHHHPCQQEPSWSWGGLTNARKSAELNDAGALRSRTYVRGRINRGRFGPRLRHSGGASRPHPARGCHGPAHNARRLISGPASARAGDLLRRSRPRGALCGEHLHGPLGAGPGCTFAAGRAVRKYPAPLSAANRAQPGLRGDRGRERPHRHQSSRHCQR